jgi:hypothetical protein
MQNLALKNDECKTGAVPMAEGRVKWEGEEGMSMTRALYKHV